ncbi:MAG: rRNA (cytosine1402-N4)-methyltransferase [Candidatus Parcubacteria bacterium]|jgi:16S rRNA (cytosine1402-N4)-methyltransferase|nr:rRNA (cytosine1402-N4)-methyltransferase [Candidatus Parcubacteria bacterium]
MGNVRDSIHKPVLLHEIVEAFRLEDGLWYLDGTVGGGGHALAIAEAYRGRLKIVGLDRDQNAIELAGKILEGKAEKIILVNEDFRHLDMVLDRHGIKAVDLILFDLGISSDELESSGKGFSFQKDEPLFMTYGQPEEYPFTAGDIVNRFEESVIADIIFGYGEERYGRRIAKAIVSRRQKKPIETSGELAEIVKLAVPASYRYGKIHPATRTFQALRIAVNGELEALKEGLKKGYERLNRGGRLAVISFHSLEDRIVKHFFKEQSDHGGRLLTKKPVRPQAAEIEQNPRSRSAKLRIIQKGNNTE